MLFTTSTFVFLFLPIVLIGFYAIGSRSAAGAAAWLFVTSIFFYGYWLPAFALLLLGSIGVNFALGVRIANAPRGGGLARAWLVTGIALNLAVLGYFKYANFFIENLNTALGFEWRLGEVILPIGISFYTFTQIAYLVDAWYGKVREASFIQYGLFVTFFPQLVAGPILHHSQMMPQFADSSVYKFDGARFWGGLAIFCIGLFKKVVLADGIAPYADAVFLPVDGGAFPSTHEAWLAALAYTLQLYFDFSGYSDMAIGLSLMFNIQLPFNFNSPYKASSITDFWRRWHISLSTFLRDYLYVPLGGNRKGSLRRYVNLMTTMVLGGLWHGAGWSFVLWGTLHGAYLVVNHAFQALTARLGWRPWLDSSKAYAAGAWALTFVCVVVAWVFFRAETLPGAIRIIQAMAGQSIESTDEGLLYWNAGLQTPVALVWCIALGAAAIVLPNSNRLGERVIHHLQQKPSWRAALGGAAFAACAALVILNLARDSVSAFIYFNF